MTHLLQGRLRAVAIGVALSVSLTAAQTAAAHDHHDRGHETTTPIKHVIIVIGENHTFDNLYGTYQPRVGQRIENLLQKGIVNADGTPGRHHAEAVQRVGLGEGKYQAITESRGKYQFLPRPYTTYA